MKKITCMFQCRNQDLIYLCTSLTSAAAVCCSIVAVVISTLKAEDEGVGAEDGAVGVVAVFDVSLTLLQCWSITRTN
jgi:hypothetical protein